MYVHSVEKQIKNINSTNIKLQLWYMSFTRFYNFLFYCSVCGPDQAGSSEKNMIRVQYPL